MKGGAILQMLLDQFHPLKKLLVPFLALLPELFPEIKDAVLVIRKSEEIRPAEQPDLEAISMLMDRLGRTVERIHRTGAVCTRDQLIRILDRMGGVVASWVDSETAQKIIEAWKNLDVEGRSRFAIPPGVRVDEGGD
jgi:hypothetical protein